MKKVFYFLLAIILFCSCSNKDIPEVYIYKEYTKIGIYDTKMIRQDTIYATNDTLAYRNAYEKFIISTRVFIEMSKKAEEKGLHMSDNKPYNFMLLDAKNNSVSNKLTDMEKAKIESEIYNITHGAFK